MQTAELVIWSAMLGGLAAIASFALIDAVIRHSVASRRTFVFVALTGSACVVMSGLPQAVFPGVGLRLFHTLQNILGLFSGALALSYLGLWMGTAADDRVVRIAIRLGSAGMAVSGLVLGAITLLGQPDQWHSMLVVTASVSALAVLLPVLVAIRAIAMGDRTAWGVLGANGLLACAVAGLHAHALQIPGLGLPVWAATAACTVSFFMLSAFLVLRRDRLNRHLERLASLAQGDDAATGLPRGAVLLSKLDDAIWRGARNNRDCTVICLRLANLYELTELVGHHADKQILSAMSARLRRAIGFRHLVGLYHPQVFVVVMLTDKDSRLVEKAVQRLHYMMAKPLQLTGLDDAIHSFIPRMGVGVVRVTPENYSPATVLEQAEQRSLANPEP